MHPAPQPSQSPYFPHSQPGSYALRLSGYLSCPGCTGEGAQDSTGGREALSLGPCLPPAALRTPGGDQYSHVSSRYQPYAKDVEAWKIEIAGPERPRKKELYAK